MILFLNGLPLVVMELKSPTQEDAGVENAYNQLRNYMQDIPSLFLYNAICVISDLTANRADINHLWPGPLHGVEDQERAL